VVLGHTGGTFCAGADLSEATGGDPQEAAAGRARELAALLRSIVECPVPVIGAIDGHVRAGGMGLVGACDIVIAGPRSTFALTEVRIGVAPAIISLTLLPKLDPRAAARYYLTGETFDSRRATKLGLVTSTADDVGFAVDAVTADLARASPQGGPGFRFYAARVRFVTLASVCLPILHACSIRIWSLLVAATWAKPSWLAA
jgi:enoyl-CoA hydratase